MTSQLDTFPDTPDDIVRLIFEAAVQKDRSAALSLVLVALHVQKWIQPLQFKAVRLRDEQGAETFLQEVTSNPTRLGIHVQTMILCLDRVLRLDLSKAIIDSLPHLSTLSMWLYSNDIRSFFSSGLPSLRRMCLSVGYRYSFNEILVLYEDITPFLPESLTHLELAGGTEYTFITDKGLKHLSRLTHLIVRYDWFGICRFVEKWLLHLPNSLQQIIIAIVPLEPRLVGSLQHIHDLPFSWIIERCDPRVVFVMGPADERHGPSDHRVTECILFNTLTPAGDWCTSPSGRKDIWDKATEMQEKVARLRLTYREDSKAT
ncbi:hypothetical protein C8J56DRAFT_1083730 [Mycena floridula]|nr:hypothetical protein C8J56DRAFT_1083730 [Mycena floridula]